MSHHHHMSHATEFWGNASDGTPLNPIVFTPPDPNTVAPAVLVIHGGGFRSGSPGPSDVCQDVANAGFWAIAIPYRLAPQGHLPGQVTKGHFPDQTDDIGQLITHAQADPRFGGIIHLIGGSA